MRRLRYLLFLAVILPGFLLPGSTSLAASGLPDSADFGYGARLDLNGNNPEGVVQLAHGYNLDWVALDFDWQQMWPDVNAQPDTSLLYRLASAAGQRGLNVLLSISNPPAWVMSQAGPDPNMTASLVETLVSAYPETFLAVELFPGANTVAGWGTTPDPHSYLLTLEAVDNRLRGRGFSAVVIASLTPTAASPEGDISDLLFLQALYGTGAAPVFPIVGLRYREITGAPQQSPASENDRLLRHYEQVRSVMLDGGHTDGLIWITGFSCPNQGNSPAEQAQWTGQAYDLLKRQPFIGAAFFNWLNIPGSEGARLSPTSLVGPELKPLPTLEAISQVASNNVSQSDSLTNPDPIVNDEITAALQSSESQTVVTAVLVKKFVGKEWLRKGH